MSRRLPSQLRPRPTLQRRLAPRGPDSGNGSRTAYGSARSRQAELFNEVHRWATADWKKLQKKSNLPREAERYYEIVRDFLRAAEKAWGDAWGHAGFMVTKPVTLKALLRVCADLAADDAEPKDDRVKRWAKRLAPWTEQVKQFRVEGFYERFPAKGQVERVARIHRELARMASIERRGKLADDE